MLFDNHAELQIYFVDCFDLIAALDLGAKITVRNLDQIQELAFQIVALMLEAVNEKQLVHQVF
jgi:hypothetical protein